MIINKIQKLVMIIYTTIATCLCLFYLPAEIIINEKAVRYDGRKNLFDNSDLGRMLDIDMDRLIIEIFVITIISGLIFFLVGNKKK